MSTTKTVEEYIKRNPSIRDSLHKGIINYAALARYMLDDLSSKELSSMEAVIISLRRIKEKFHEPVNDKRIINLLKKSSLVIKNRVCVAILEKDIYPDNLLDLEKQLKREKHIFYAIEGTNAITLLFEKRDSNLVKAKFKSVLVDFYEDMSIISINCDGVEGIPGVIAYLSSLFYDNDININQLMSCHNDNLFVVKETDVATCMQFLKF